MRKKNVNFDFDFTPEYFYKLWISRKIFINIKGDCRKIFT